MGADLSKLFQNSSYTAVVIFGDYKRNLQSLFFVLMTNKTQALHERIFDPIKEVNPQLPARQVYVRLRKGIKDCFSEIARLPLYKRLLFPF